MTTICLGDNHLFRWQPSGKTGGELEQAILLTELLFKSTNAGLAGQEKCSLKKWASADENKRLQFKPWKSAIQTLKKIKARKEFYPNIHTLQLILATLPFTTASAERSFNCLKRLKTYLQKIWEKRGFLDWHRCNSTHAQVPNPQALLDELGKKKRKLDFLLW